MPLFKKFLSFMSIILIILVVAYIIIYNHTYITDEKLNPIKDYSKVLNYGMKDLYHYFCIQFIDSFSDTIVYLFTFHYGDITINEKCFLVIIGICSLPFLITFFQFLTFRGFQAFKLRFKKAKANPYYYHDYVEQNKDFGNDNIEEQDLSLMPILIPIRLLVLIIILILLPILILGYLVFEFIGLIRGITKTGRALDFE
ncbi:MAG: hypothetical protein J6Y28_00205 [Acholeplasmatales bacterium]|nr:hypothetical protein [Acholeplasmatales bacterium]